MKVKTRFAPSPTGSLHVGGLRTALYSYLYAKKHDGIFMLRIEDTDQKRYVEGSVESLQNSLKFFGLDWDEGPYFQSHRSAIYTKYVEELLANGHAYKCYCTPERLEKMRTEQAEKKQAPKYDRLCLNNQDQEGTYVIRQLIPDENILFQDEIRGEISFHGKDIDDQVLMKSDGFPTYHLANVVDDHEMDVTHVIRGEEWLPSTPKHLWLYKAFGWTAPSFAHLPLLLNPDKTKLSKRQGDVAAEDYIKKGYLKEAMINFIAFLGWNPGGEKEIYTIEELIAEFSFEKVQKAGAVFGLDKLDWLNGLYLRKKTPEELGELILPYLQECEWYKDELVTKLSEKEKTAFISCIQTRMKTLSDGPAMLKPFLLDKLDYYLQLFNHEKMKVDKATAILAIENSIPALEKLEDWSSDDSIKTVLTEVIAKLGVKNGQVLWPLRVALSNEEFSPGVFELMVVLGKEKSLKRLKEALEVLKE